MWLSTLRSLVLLLALSFLTACGGGGGGGGNGDPNPGPPPPPPPTSNEPTIEALNAASLLASQATFGMPYEHIVEMARMSPEAWIEAQFAAPTSLHVPVVNEFERRRLADELPEADDIFQWLIQFRRFAWWHQAVTAEDQLRQRVAYALSQILVVSDNVDALIIDPYALSTYQDLLLNSAFGNYRDLLEAVTRSPAMGLFLSHVNNRRADSANNLFPDENYAREVMQLFSIGLFELNLDGTLRLGTDGQPIPTYDNADIESFARVFTGLSWGGPDAFFGKQEPNFRVPMVMFEEAHDTDTKTLLSGVTLPAGQSGDEDLAAAIDNLFEHPNVGPFVALRLIQRLVTSNPSPAYVERVARAFNGESGTPRGDMKAVIRAVLLDPEAAASGSMSGKMREPVLRTLALFRQFGASSTYDFFTENGFVLQTLARQHPLSSPSVFNFFLPDHQPSGALADAGLVAPEFQIVTAPTVVGMTNYVDAIVYQNQFMISEPSLGTATLDLDEYIALAASDVQALVDRLELIAVQGRLSAQTRAAVLDVVGGLDDATLRTMTAIYMIYTSPDYVVEG